MQAIIDPTSIRVIYDFDKISNQDTYNYENNDMIVENKLPKAIGTGFFLDSNNIFITSKHVLFDKFNTLRDVGILKQTTCRQLYKFHKIKLDDVIIDDEIDIAVCIVVDSDTIPAEPLYSNNSVDIKYTNMFVAGYESSTMDNIKIHIRSLVKGDVRERDNKEYTFNIENSDAIIKGGYSGGPVITDTSSVIGLVIESNIINIAVATSVRSIMQLLYKKILTNL